MSIDVIESSCFDVLWQQFEQALDAPLPSPLACELVVVPATGWESSALPYITESSWSFKRCRKRPIFSFARLIFPA